ncbi:MAG: hypothetical protein IMZ44_16395 [Planctomycetes bacterium]|nr:hypothetical protein [Planctomycetota bacterium]
MRFHGDTVDAAPARPSRRRKVLLGILGVLFLAAVILISLLKWTPAVYERTSIIGPDPAAQARFNEEVVNKIGNVMLDRSGGTRLDLSITEEMINARIAGFMAELERAGRPLPAAVRDLRVGFEPDRIVLATAVGRGLTRLVVSQDLRVERQPDGSLQLTPTYVWAGAVPFPAALLAGVQRTLTERLMQDAPAEDEKSVDLGRYGIEALEGSPVFLGKGRKRVLADRLEIQAGVIHIEGHRADAPKPPQP